MSFKTVFILVAILISLSVAHAQTTEKPQVGYSNTDNTIIENVIVRDDMTIVMISYWKTRSNAHQAWVSWSSNTFLIDNDTYRRYQVVKVYEGQGRPLYFNEKFSTTSGKKGEVYGKNTAVWNFTLVFPKLPPGAENLDLVEEINGDFGFVWRNISIKNPLYDISTDWNEAKLKSKWEDNGVKRFEGIYEATSAATMDGKYRLGLVQSDSGYNLIFLGGSNSDNWKPGDVKAIITKTAANNIYSTKWYMSDKSINEDVYISFRNGFLDVVYTTENRTTTYIKLYPIGESTNESSPALSSGTAFAINEMGYLVTNSHVVGDAESITVKGIGGVFRDNMKAEIIVNDKNNDICLLKIVDPGFSSFRQIPYSIRNITADVGEDVFALGYPLRATMGDEIKLTNGIISSKSGFQGDITSYQTTVPIQPGNSGGPLFNNQGELIGIVSAKHGGADNASYAIKSGYLLNLLNSLDIPHSNQKSSTLESLSLANKAKNIRDFVYIIEVN